MKRASQDGKKGTAPKKLKQPKAAAAPLPDESDDEDAGAVAVHRAGAASSAEAPPTFDGQYVNKQRVLVFCSRGVTARARHLLEDLRRLVQHFPNLSAFCSTI